MWVQKLYEVGKMWILHLKTINVALAMLSKLKKMRLFQVIFKHCICSFPSGSRGIPFLQIPQVERDEKVVGRWVCECHHWAFTLTYLHPYLQEKESHLVTGKLLHFVHRSSRWRVAEVHFCKTPVSLVDAKTYYKAAACTSVADFNTIWQAVSSLTWFGNS